MKKTLQVAGAELKLLFYSPIAWFLLIVFLFQAALVFTGKIEVMQQSQELGAHFSNLTGSVLTASYNGLFPSIVNKLYLYIPLLTMGLISREMNTGTIKLLYSSPLKVREIVLGKFLAMVAYCSCLIAILLLLVIVGWMNVPHWDMGLAFSGLLGIFLLLCTYSAIGLFMSALTSYQVVAAISTFVVFAILAYVGTMWQDVDFVRDLTYFLSISGRTEKMIAGLIGTNDLLYFMMIVCMFLGFSILKLNGERQARSGLKKALGYLGILSLVLLVGYIGSRPSLVGYWDTTRLRTNTLTENAQKVISQLDSPLQITTYVNLLGKNFSRGTPAQRNVDLKRWEPYMRFKPDIKMKYVYYYDSTDDPNLYKYNKGKTIREIAERYMKVFKMDTALFKTPAEIRQEIDLRPEANAYVMQLRYKGKSTFLRLYNDYFVYPSETEVIAAIKRLTVKLPKIYFAEGSYERSPAKSGDKDYKVLTSEKAFRYAFINQGFDVDTLSLRSRDIPADITALVLADPRTGFTAGVLAKLQNYIAAGGDLVILGEPGKQAVLNPLLKTLGVQLSEGQLVELSDDNAPDLIRVNLTKYAADFSRSLTYAYEDSIPVSMPGATALLFRDSGSFRIRPLLATDSLHSWLKMGTLTLDSAAVGFNRAAGDKKGEFVTALSLTRKVKGKRQRILISGDADLMSNAELRRNNVRTANFRFNTALFGWFTEGQFPVDTFRPRSKDNHLDLSDTGVSAIKAILLWMLPGLFFIFGTVLLIRRKRK